MKKVNSAFLDNYKEDAVNALLQMNPEWNREDVEEIVYNEMKKNFSNPDVVIDNNFIHSTEASKLLTIFDWSLGHDEALIAGNGTFYKNQYDGENPIANMLDGMLKKRKAFKKEMFKVEDKTSDKYKDLDLKQQIQKVNANSYYGASGMPASAFFSKWSGPATTSSAQSVISTCYSTFEGFICDNFLFYDLNECMNWLKIVREQIEEDPETDFWVVPHDTNEVYEKLRGMFVEWKDSYEEPLREYVSHLSQNELTRIYYRNRLEEFTRDHNIIQSLHRTIMKNINVYPVLSKDTVEHDENWEDQIPKKFRGTFSTANEYNAFACNEAFMDPNNIPESVKEEIEELTGYYMKYVYTRYLVFDRIYRLKNFGRKTVMVIDTDSNILVLDGWVSFILNEVITDSDKDQENKEFIIINTITYALTTLITDTLLYYGKCSNIPEEFRPRYNMKNEFFMRRLVVSEVKKRYMSLFKLREGNLLNPPKTDIKGFDFKKASTSDVCEKIFTKLSEDYLLKADTIDVKGLREELRKLENKIRADIEAGNLTYLPIANAKELSAYADPGSEQSVRGVIAWNSLNPDSKIDLPAKVKMLKLTLFKEEDIEPLKRTHPEIYRVLKKEVFEDKSGIFVTQKIKDGKVNVKSKGLQVLALPANGQIPDWVKPYIDYGSVIGNIMGPFKSVTDLLKLNCVVTGYSKNGVNRETENFTNMISF